MPLECHERVLSTSSRGIEVAASRHLAHSFSMSGIVRRLVSKAIEQVAGSGVGIDESGRLYFPDGLDPERVHRFIELVTAKRFATPKSALVELFERVGVPASAIEALEEVLSDEGQLLWAEIGRHPLHLGGSLPAVREIPIHFRRFLVEGLGLADENDDTLEEAAVSTRLRAAEAFGCDPTWDEILARPDEVGELAKRWRESSGASS
jgi:hypothetical protein